MVKCSHAPCGCGLKSHLPQVRDLTPFALALEFIVEEYAAGRGKIPPVNRRRKKVVFVATIEKASGLVNCLAETGCLQSLGLVVVDEVRKTAPY